MDEPKLKYRVGWLKGCLILSIAAVSDLLQILLNLTIALSFVGDFLTIFAEGFILIFFFFCRLHFLRGKKAASKVVTMITMTVIEMVPFLNALPTLTFGTFNMIRLSRSEDREEFKAKRKKWRQEQAAQQARAEASADRSYNQYFREVARTQALQEQKLEDA